MKNGSLLILTVLLVLICPVPLCAEPAGFTLEEAVRSALANRPLVQAQAAQTTVERERQAAAASGYLPRLSLEERFFATNEPGGSLFISLNQQDLELSSSADAYNDAPSRKDFETRLRLDQTLYDADIGFQSRRAATAAAASLELERQSREQAALTVIEAYLDIQADQATIVRTRAALQEGEEVLAIARQREQAGVGLPADTLRAKTLVNEARLGLLTARQNLRLARHRLAFAMGLAKTEVGIAAPLTLEALPEPAYTEHLQRGDLAALRLQAEEAELAARQAGAGLLPKARLQASYMLHDGSLPFGAEADAWSVMAGINWQFFDGFERSHRQAAAAARRKATMARATDRERQVLLALEEVRLQSERAAFAVELAESARDAATEAKLITLDRYEAGLAPLSELLGVQAELEKARQALVKAQTDRIRVRALAHFQQGTLLQALAIPEMESKE